VSDTTTDIDERDRKSLEQPPPPAAGRVLLFALCFAMLLGGFYLMGWAFDHASITLFSVGIALSGGGFFLAMHRPER
jgi:hypothetical protein